MKKALIVTAAAVFALSFGIAYADEVSSVRAYDTFQIESPVAHAQVAEGSAAGSPRDTNLVEGPAVSSVRAYDDFQIARPAARTRTVEGSAAGSLRHNFASKQSSVRAYDLFEIGG